MRIAILHRVWQCDPQLTRYVHRFSSKIAILRCKQNSDPPKSARFTRLFATACRMYRVFFAFLGGNRGMYRVFACFSSAFCRFQKESFVNRLFFDPRLVVDSALRGRGSKNHRFPLNSFWKSTIFDAGSSGRSQESKNHRFSFEILLES